MTQLYSSNLEKVKLLAKQEATKLRHEFVTAEHLLLGLLALKDCQAALFLRRKGQKYKQEHQACYRFLYYIHCIIHVFDGLLICMWYCRDIETAQAAYEHKKCFVCRLAQRCNASA